MAGAATLTEKMPRQSLTRRSTQIGATSDEIDLFLCYHASNHKLKRKGRKNLLLRTNPTRHRLSDVCQRRLTVPSALQINHTQSKRPVHHEVGTIHISRCFIRNAEDEISADHMYRKPVFILHKNSGFRRNDGVCLCGPH